jgi:hypothetical protein
MGNVDVRYIRQQGNHGTARIAQYLSKYISKGFDSLERFNKKRYWASDHDLPEAQRIWLRSRTLLDAIKEVVARSGNSIQFGQSGGGFFTFRISPASGSPCIQAKALHHPSNQHHAPTLRHYLMPGADKFAHQFIRSIR